MHQKKTIKNLISIWFGVFHLKVFSLDFHLICMATVSLQGDMHLPRAKAAQNLSPETLKLPQNQLLSFYNGVEFNYIFPASRRGL